jgi:2-keto-4-pentenoate hydratase
VVDGYAVQAMLADQRGDAVLGWKIAATSAAGRAHISVEHPLAGRLYQPIVLSDGATVELGANRMGVAEAEFVLVVNRDLPPQETPYTEEQIAQAIGELRPGLEIPDSRFSDFTKVGAASLIADNACAQLFVLGEPTTETFDPRALGEHGTQLLVNDQVVTRGTGDDAMGGPLVALTWLVNTINAQGLTLHSGEFVTTGVTGAPSPIAPGDTVRVDLGKFGSVQTLIR